MKIKIPISVSYAATFLLLTFLCYQAHEMFHHFLGALLCGGFGRMTFTVFNLNEQCAASTIVTLAGPALTFAIAWFGAYLLKKRRNMLFAYTLVFASFAHLRFLLPLGGSGDEWLITRGYFAQPNKYLLAVFLLVIGMPPALYAFKFIANRWRVSVLVVSLLLPMIILTGLAMLDDNLFPKNVAPVSIIGVPLVVWIVNLSALALFIFVGFRYLRRRAQFQNYE